MTDKNGKELKLTDKGNGKYTFTMPASKVEVNATFVKEVEISPFSDVSTSAYYYEAVKWAQEKGHHRRYWQRPLWTEPALHPRTDRHLPVACCRFFRTQEHEQLL